MVDVVIDRWRRYGARLRRRLEQIFLAFMVNWCWYNSDLMFSQRSYPEINRIGRSPEAPTSDTSAEPSPADKFGRR